MKKQLFSVLTLGAAAALGLTACGGGDGSPGTQAPTSYEISLRADKTSLPVNIGGQGPGIGAYAPYTTTLYVRATERGHDVPEGTPFACNIATGLDSGVLYYLDGENDPEDDDGNITPSRAIVLESNAGRASFHVHAIDRVGQVEVVCSVTDAAGISHSATEIITVGSGGAGHAGMPASVVYQAGRRYLGSAGNLQNIPNSMSLQAIVRDELGQAVTDPARANVQVRILRNTEAAKGARLFGASGGDVVQATTRGGVADFSIASGPERGAILLEMTVDRFDNDVTNGIQDPIAQLLSVTVVHGISAEPLRMMPSETIAATVGEEIEPLPLEAEGGEAPYRWTALDSLPDGLTLTPSGILYGLPTAASGTYVVPVQVMDQFGEYDEGEIIIAVSFEPLAIKIDGMPSSVAPNASVAFAVDAIGGVPPYQWELIGSSWLSIDSNGIVRGTAPDTDGTHSFVIQVTDDAGTVKRVNASIEVKTP